VKTCKARSSSDPALVLHLRVRARAVPSLPSKEVAHTVSLSNRVIAVLIRLLSEGRAQDFDPGSRLPVAGSENASPEVCRPSDDMANNRGMPLCAERTCHPRPFSDPRRIARWFACLPCFMQAPSMGFKERVEESCASPEDEEMSRLGTMSQ
jgi:hypothetical protein